MLTFGSYPRLINSKSLEMWPVHLLSESYFHDFPVLSPVRKTKGEALERAPSRNKMAPLLLTASETVEKRRENFLPRVPGSSLTTCMPSFRLSLTIHFLVPFLSWPSSYGLVPIASDRRWLNSSAPEHSASLLPGWTANPRDKRLCSLPITGKLEWGPEC